MSNDITILFIDDQQDFLDTVTHWMKPKGYHVITVNDPQAGIDLVKAGRADILFLDFKMPGMNGNEVLKRIRQFNKTIPIILITAYPQDAMIQPMEWYNISGFFSKMANLSDLEKLLDVIVRKVRPPKDEKEAKGK